MEAKDRVRMEADGLLWRPLPPRRGSNLEEKKKSVLSQPEDVKIGDEVICSLWTDHRCECECRWLFVSVCGPWDGGWTQPSMDDWWDRPRLWTGLSCRKYEWMDGWEDGREDKWEAGCWLYLNSLLRRLPPLSVLLLLVSPSIVCSHPRWLLVSVRRHVSPFEVAVTADCYIHQHCLLFCVCQKKPWCLVSLQFVIQRRNSHCTLSTHTHTHT